MFTVDIDDLFLTLNQIRTGALGQWSKLPAWKVGYRGFKPCSGILVSKKQNVSPLLTPKDLILWGASRTEK